MHYYARLDCLSCRARTVYFILFFKAIAACTLLIFAVLLFQTHIYLGNSFKKGMNINAKEDVHIFKKLHLM